jgi:uncharacterized OsmC-like protein
MKVSLSLTENLNFKASARHFTGMNVDEPESFHGTDIGPSSVEYLLIGIGGCLATTFAYSLQRRSIGVNGIDVVVDGRLAHVEPKKRLRLINVDVKITYLPQPNTSLKKINMCIEEFEEFCIVSQSIQNGFPINVECINNQDE